MKITIRYPSVTIPTAAVSSFVILFMYVHILQPTHYDIYCILHQALARTMTELLIAHSIFQDLPILPTITILRHYKNCPAIKESNTWIL